MSHVAQSTPYPWPWHGQLDPTRTALVVTGWDTGWRDASSHVDRALANVFTLASTVTLTFTIGHDPTPRHPRPSEDLEPLRFHHHAPGVDAFYGTPLEIGLRRHGVDLLLVAGFGLETTVHSTLRTANDTGLECLLVVDACAPLDPDLVGSAVSMIEMSGGIFGAVGTTEHVVAAFRRSQLIPVPEVQP